MRIQQIYPAENCTRFQAFLWSVNTTLELVWIKKASIYRLKMSLHTNKKAASYEAAFKMVGLWCVMNVLLSYEYGESPCLSGKKQGIVDKNSLVFGFWSIWGVKSLVGDMFGI